MNKLARYTAICFVVLLVNTAYVASFPSATIFYMIGWTGVDYRVAAIYEASPPPLDA